MIAKLRAAGFEVLDGHRNRVLTMHEKRVLIDAKGVAGNDTNMQNALWRNGKAAALKGVAHDDQLVRHAQPWVQIPSGYLGGSFTLMIRWWFSNPRDPARYVLELLTQSPVT